MEIKLTEKGKCKGNISVAGTAKTMEVGETWRMEATNATQLANIRTACFVLAKQSDMNFSVTTENNTIIIKRTL